MVRMRIRASLRYTSGTLGSLSVIPKWVIPRLGLGSPKSLIRQQRQAARSLIGRELEGRLGDEDIETR